MIGWFCLKGTEVECLTPKCCWIIFFYYYFYFPQGFCEALTGLSGSLLRQSCVGKRDDLFPCAAGVPGSAPDPASVKSLWQSSSIGTALAPPRCSCCW